MRYNPLNTCEVKIFMPLSDSDFCLLCRNGLYDEIKSAVIEGAFVNAVVNLNHQSVMAALKSFLLRKNNSSTTTPLLEAAANNPSSSIIELLYEYGADPDKPNSAGLTPLETALSAGRTSNALALLRVCRDDDGTGKNRALISAAKDGNIPAVRELIRTGADLNARDSEGNTALMTAVITRHVKTANIIIEAAGDSIKHKDEVLIKAVSAQKPSQKLIEKLLEWGASAKSAVSYARENRALMGSRILRRIIRESR